MGSSCEIGWGRLGGDGVKTKDFKRLVVELPGCWEGRHWPAKGPMWAGRIA